MKETPIFVAGDRSTDFEQLARSRAGALAFLAFLALGAIALFVPLLQLPGYELAEALTLLGAVLAGPLALAASRGARSPGPLPAAWATGLWLTVLTLGVVALAILRATFGSHCDPFANLVFLVLLPLPTCWLAALLGAGCVSLGKRTNASVWLYGGLVLALLLHGAWPAYAGPQAFGYDHLLGYVPGPLYDENLTAPHALWLFRGLTLALICVAVLLLAVVPKLTVPLFALAVWLTGPLEHRLGSRSSVADLDRALGAVRSLDGLTIHAPRELSDAKLESLLRAALVARAQVAQALEVPEQSRVDVFLHRSSAEKAALTGAGQTHFTKPWRSQIQTEVDAPQVLRHEMVHALAAAWGKGLFGIGEGLDLHIGLVEGLAEAVDNPADRYTLQEWSAGLRAAHLWLAPKDLLDTSAHFYGAPQGKAYTVAGAFVQFLLATQGAKKLAALYRSGDWQRSLGQGLPALSEAFEVALGAVSVSPQLQRAAAERFRQRPLFARPCGREVAGLVDAAHLASQAGQPLEAARLLARCAALDPSDPKYLEARWQTLREAKAQGASQALADLLASPAADDALRARVALQRGGVALAAGVLAEARADFEEARALGLDPPLDRAAQIWLLALGTTDLTEPLHRYFEGAHSDLGLLGLDEASAAHPDFAPLPYLLGLSLAARDEPVWALRELGRALALGLPPDLAAQALRVQTNLELDLQEREAARRSLIELRALPRPAAEQRQAEDLDSRLAIEARLFPTAAPATAP